MTDGSWKYFCEYRLSLPVCLINEIIKDIIHFFYFGIINESKSSVTKELFVKLFFFNAYYVGIAVIARWPESDISSKLLLTIKTFDIWHKFYRNATITHVTQKSLDYFIIRFLSFYQINATKVEKIVFLLRCQNEHFVTENSFTKINFIVSFLVIIECGVGIDSKFQC
jgi:hypothetical protein